MQMYQMGKFLRNRYSGFLPAEYFPNDTVAEYNPYDRDFASAACLLAGLYPPVGMAVWHDSIPWQPIPVHLHQFDICDLAKPGVCPTFYREYLKEIGRYNEESFLQQDLLDHVSHHTGTSLTNLSQLALIYDALLMQQQNGYKLPYWSDSVMEQMRLVKLRTLAAGFAGNNLLLQLGAGEELKYMSGLLGDKAAGKMSNTRLYVQAAHDCTLTALLRAMGLTLETPTASFIAIELLEIKPTHFVQVWFFRDLTSVPEQIDIEDCPNPCSLEGFNSFVDVWAPKDWQGMCNFNQPHERQDESSLLNSGIIENCGDSDTFTCDRPVNDNSNQMWTVDRELIEGKRNPL